MIQQMQNQHKQETLLLHSIESSMATFYKKVETFHSSHATQTFFSSQTQSLMYIIFIHKTIFPIHVMASPTMTPISLHHPNLNINFFNMFQINPLT